MECVIQLTPPRLCPALRRSLRWLCVALYVSVISGQQLGFRVLGHEDGLLNLTVTSVVQDHHGFLWVGTANGVFRYDGVGFTRFSTREGLPAAFVAGMCETADGTLWVATHRGIARYREGRFTPVPLQNNGMIQGRRPLAAFDSGKLLLASEGGVLLLEEKAAGEWETERISDASANSVMVSRESSAWFDCGPRVCRYQHDRVTEFADTEGVPRDVWMTMAEDSAGNVFVRGRNHLIKLSPAATAFRLMTDLPAGAVSHGVLHVNRQGYLIADTAHGLAIQDEDGWRTVSEENGLPATGITAVLADNEGSLWLGTSGAGLVKWTGHDRWENWTKRNGLSGNNIEALSVDAEGNAWFSTGKDLSTIRVDEHGNPSNPISIRRGQVTAIATNRDAVWTAFESQGLVRRNSSTGQIVVYGPNQGIPSSGVRSLAFDSGGRLWVGTLSGMFTGVEERGEYRFTRLEPADRRKGDLYLEVSPGRNGVVWVATTRGLLALHSELRRWTRYGSADGLRQDRIRHVAPHPDGSLLISYSDALGVSRLWFDEVGRVTRVNHYDPANGLRSDRIYSLAVDGSSRVWVGTDAGVDVLEQDRWTHYGSNDGLVWNDCVHSALAVDRRNGVWIGTTRGLSHYIPPPTAWKPPSPRVAISAWSFGDQSSRQTLGPGSPPPLLTARGKPALQVTLAGLTFLRDGARFRYRLIGIDKGWVESTQRELRYAALPAGRYTFEAYAVTPQGVRSERPVTMTFQVYAPWWRAWWVLAAAIAILALLVRAAWVVRMRLVLAQQQVLEEAVRARTEVVESQKEEIARLLNAAEEANRAKTSFLANMSHEIRTPLNGVLGMADLLLLSNQLDPEQESNAAALRKSALSLMRLLNDLLDMSKIESGKFELEQAPFLVTECVGDTVKLMRGVAQEKGLCIEEIQNVEEIVVLGDCVRLRQVLINLTANAIKFTSSGTVRIAACLLSAEPERARIEFSVQDEGIGIPVERREHIFQAFEQAELSTHRRFGGTGLGLSISRELVERMGGVLAVESEVGKGSRFSFSLDLERVSDVPCAEAADAQQLTAVRRDLRVLLCEDNLVNQRVATRMLETLGARITIANNGREALDLYAAFDFDLILMDLMMPELDGVEAAQEIRTMERSVGRRTPIIALTASAYREDVERCMAAGMDGYLSKPFVRTSLVAEMNRVFQTTPCATD